MSKVAQDDMSELKDRLKEEGIDASDEEIQDALKETKTDSENKAPDLKKLVEELSDKVNKLDTDMKKMKNEKIKDNFDADLNDSIFQTAMKKRAMFINIMDELDDLAEKFSSTHPEVTKKIDDISDQIRFYNRKG